ncbi:Csm2p [Saccharomyces cerevisiae P283]|uniref:Csm2p n=2 Tax=Saccharomyces TaxID=4930 RepID=H0GHS2_SACCK|nr:YIL132Cp-like protein [Saccharomyces cerevisiae AWRI1631]EHN06585.1 Csm2p [Saccharomyces cerevisiae x Saccharomyces kudriavzevii VIN7]EWG95418.1 Csm2p [Saccharomyces cerevisiae R103]EWH17853.1 Csm2p [Saccharomyces cerevisiae P283]
MEYEDLELITIWSSPTKDKLCQFIKQDLSKEHVVTQLFFIDATSSFPLSQFQKLVPPTLPENVRIYENIRINTCLDLEELSAITVKLLQILSMNKINAQRGTEDAVTEPLKIILYINGLEVMFRNSQFKSSPQRSHELLRDTLLKLRVMGNDENENASIRTLLEFPKEQLLDYYLKKTTIQERHLCVAREGGLKMEIPLLNISGSIMQIHYSNDYISAIKASVHHVTPVHLFMKH